MNYHQPRQIDPNADRPDAGKWRYTNMNDGSVWPEGYCWDCPGHDTKEGAYEHQTLYVLDHATYDGRWANTQYRCEADVPTGGINISGQITSPPTGTKKCDKWTDRFAEVDYMRTYNLCDAHRNRETVTALFGSIGDSFGSE